MIQDSYLLIPKSKTTKDYVKESFQDITRKSQSDDFIIQFSRTMRVVTDLSTGDEYVVVKFASKFPYNPDEHKVYSHAEILEKINELDSPPAEE